MKTRRLSWIVGLGLVLASCTTESGSSVAVETTSNPGSSTSVRPPPSAGDRPIIGVAVPGGTAAGVAAVEQSADAPIDLVRLFLRWDDVLPNAEVSELVDKGHLIHLSVRPRTTDGTTVLWADLASAEPGTATYGQFVAWVDRLAELPEGSYVTINHEPETGDSAANGTAEDFVAMWRRFAQLVDEREGDHLRLVWTMTGGAFRDGRAELWYPGDDVVDLVGADLYNWFTCQGTNRAWIEFDRLLVEPLAFAQAHDKPLAVPEMGSVEDPSQAGRKGEWIDNASAAIGNSSLMDELEFVAWFDVTAPGGTFPNCVWDHDTSTESAEAFARLVSEFSAGG